MVVTTQSNIQEFFKNKTIFITGGTGFLGKLIVNKLIRSCPQIKRIYMLVREKKGKTPNERLKDIFNLPIFKDIESSKLQRIIALNGDCGQVHLGLSDHDVNTIIQEVNVIFHSAATVRFDERLDIAIGINVIGPREMVKIAHKMENLQSYVHVSTVFSNCQNKHIEEKFYNLPYSYEKLIHLYKTKSWIILEKMKPFLLGSMPNTYVMTKAAAEQLIKNETEGLPITIFRPAIVIATFKEPLPGWIDNLYGPTGIVTGVMTGIIKALPCDQNAVTDLVPADLTVNALIAASWDTNAKYMAINKQISKYKDDPCIYNYVSSSENPLTWIVFSKILMKILMERPTIKAMWYPTLIMNSSIFLHKLTVLILHYLPAFILDLILIVSGKKLRLVKQYKKIERFTDVLVFFSTQEWTFSNKNIQRLWESLNKTDKILFPFDIKQMQWVDYLDNYHNGILTFLLKEKKEMLPAAKKRLKGLHVCHMIFKGAVYVGLIMLIWMIIKRIFFI